MDICASTCLEVVFGSCGTTDNGEYLIIVGNDSPVGGVGPTQYSASPTPLVAVCVARLSVLVSVGEAVTVVLEKTAPTGQSWQISTIARL